MFKVLSLFNWQIALQAMCISLCGASLLPSSMFAQEATSKEVPSSETRDSQGRNAAFQSPISSLGGALPELGIPISSIPGKVWVDGGSVIVAIADDGKQAFAYCETFPKWTAQEIDVQPNVKTVPIVGGDNVAVYHGHLCYAYSSKQGAWATLTLPHGEIAKPSLHNAVVKVTSKTRGDFVFNSKWGKWFSAKEIKDGKVAEYLRTRELKTSVDESSLTTRFFPLSYCKAASAAEMVKRIYADAGDNENSLVIVEDIRLNQLVIKGTEAVIEKVFELLQELDRPTEGASVRTVNGGDVQAIFPHSSDENPANLERELESREKRCRDFAEFMRINSLTADPNNLETFQSIVREAFQTRQQLERAELRAFVNRVKDLEQSIEARERIAQQIVSRRVKELLDPNLKWEDPTSNLLQTAAIPTSQPPNGINNKEVTFQLVGMPERWQTHLQWLSGQGAITTNATGSHIRTSLGAKLQFRAPLSPQLVGTAGFIGIELLDPEPEKLANFHSIVKATPIPLALTLDDFEEARSGKLVTKVIYLSKDLSKSLFNSLSTREIDAGVDPIERAKELGIPIAIVRISDRQAP